MLATLLAISAAGALETTAQADTPLSVPTGLAVSPTPVGGTPGDACGAQAPYGYIGRNSVTFGATATSASNAAEGVEFSVVPSDGSASYDYTTPSISSGSQSRLTLPASDFEDGTTYTWTARATNDSGAVSDWSAPCHFIADHTSPATPVITSTDFPSFDSGSPEPRVRTTGSFHLTVSGVGASDTIAIKYRLNNTIPVGDGDSVPVAPDGTATITLTPTEAGLNTLNVESVDRAGNYGEETSYSFLLEPPATPDARGDLNGDEHADLVAAGTDGKLYELFGNGDGTVKPAISNADTPTDFAGSLIAQNGDTNGDGYQDVLRVNSFGSMQSMRNNGLGDFSQANEESAGYRDDGDLWTAATQIVLPGDFDGDGLATDVLSVENGDLLFWPGSFLGIAGPDTVIASGFTDKTVLAPGDVTGDSVPDLLIRDDKSGKLQLAPGKGDGTLTPPSDWTTVAHGFQAKKFPLITAAGDANGDSLPDLYATTARGALDFFPGQANGHVGKAVTVTGTGLDWSTMTDLA